MVGVDGKCRHTQLILPIGVPGQNNIEAVGDLPIADIAEIEKTEGLGNISYISCKG